MKLVCVKNRNYDNESKCNLTVGKVYDAAPIDVSLESYVIQTNYRFLVFNDQDEWHIYPLEFFKPLEE